MQPVQAPQGFPPKSQLLDSLKVYLSNKKRLQPIIGLGSIIECVRADSPEREGLYLCEVCVCRFGKADIRTHIMGSLHRYNYIKVWHPDLVPEWEKNCDLSKLAWPLMQIAETIEAKEGHGDVQFLEIGDASFQMAAAFSENDAETLIRILTRDHAQVRPEKHSEGASGMEPIHSQRTVILSCNHQGWSNNVSTSLPEKNLFLSPEQAVLSENRNSFLDGYKGPEPLIGLCHVVECRSEDGHTYCFLCHCCRIRSNKEDIIDHLTSSSHLMNYLMEKCPEQVEAETVGVMEDYQCLKSFARKVEQEKGRGELKLVNSPESLCVQLMGKSYHWCIKMLPKSCMYTETLKRKSEEGLKITRETPENGYTGARKKMMKASDTVFKVSIPSSEGTLLLERTICHGDSHPVSPAPLPACDSGLISSSGPWSEEYEFDSDTTLEVQKSITVSIYQDEEAYLRDMKHLKSSNHLSETNDPNLYGEWNYIGKLYYPDGSSEGFKEEWQNEMLATHTEGLLPTEYDYQDWCVEGWY